MKSPVRSSTVEDMGSIGGKGLARGNAVEEEKSQWLSLAWKEKNRENDMVV